MAAVGRDQRVVGLAADGGSRVVTGRAGLDRSVIQMASASNRL